MKRIIEKIKRYLKNDLEKEERDFLTEYHCAEYRGVPEKREQILFVENQPFYTYELEGKLTEEKQFIIKSECAGENIGNEAGTSGWILSQKHWDLFQNGKVVVKMFGELKENTVQHTLCMPLCGRMIM